MTSVITAANAANASETGETKINLENESTFLPAGADPSAITEAVTKAIEGLPDEAQANNLENGEFAANRETIIRRYYDKNSNEGVAAVALQLPTVDLLMTFDAGKAWVAKSIRAALMRKLGQLSTTWAKDTSETPNFPVALADFIKSASNAAKGTRSRFSKKLWQLNRTAYRDALVLKSGGMLKITIDEFERCLERSSFAETTFPAVPAVMWEKILDALCALQPVTWTVKGKDGTERTYTDEGDLFKHWKETRNVDPEVQEALSFDMSDFDL